jgi:hypothetical protein
MEMREYGPLCGWTGFESGKKISEGCGDGGTWERENAWPQEVHAAHGGGGLEDAFGLPGLAVFLQDHP